jgi:hypothetical protein
VSDLNRMRRERGSDTRVLNTPISTTTYRLLKEESVSRRIAIGVIIDEVVEVAARRRIKAATSTPTPSSGT